MTGPMVSLNAPLTLKPTSILTCSTPHCLYLIPPLDCKLTESGNWAFIILLVTVVNTVPSMKEVLIKYLGPGDSLGAEWTPGHRRAPGALLPLVVNSARGLIQWGGAVSLALGLRPVVSF